MDFNDKDFNDKDFNDKSDMWEWQDEEYTLQKDSGNDFSRCIWDNVNVNEDNLMYMLEEQTPIKDCADFGYQVYDFGECNSYNANKGMEESLESSQMKRRRMLQFTSEGNEIGVVNEQFTSVCLKSKVREDSMTEGGQSDNLEWNSQWNTGYQDDRCTFNFGGEGQAPVGWLANCLNESETQCSLNEMDDCMPTEDQPDVLDCYNTSHEMETDVPREPPNPSPIKIIKGRKSFLKTPKKLVTPVVYPFALIKPCGVQGDVTLKDINQRIHAPPPSRSKQKMDEDPSTAYPTSAFSGKPVVRKTKIRTEGGKGSITIMRTKG